MILFPFSATLSIITSSVSVIVPTTFTPSEYLKPVNVILELSFYEGIVRQMPWLFGIALFVMSILLYSQAATVRALVPLGIALGISPYMLIALFPAVNGYFFIPNYPTVVAAINFDRTGTTKIGRYVLNHSFMMPGLVSTAVAIGLGLLFIQIF